MSPGGDSKLPTLIVADIHQNLTWLEAVLKKETSLCGEILFLGDYFDLSPSARGGQEAPADVMALFLKELKKEMPDRLTLLIGNHDVPYLEALNQPPKRRLFRDTDSLLVYACGQTDTHTAEQISRHWDLAFWENLHGVVQHRGFLCSHAGIHPSFWPGDKDPEKAWHVFRDLVNQSLLQLRQPSTPGKRRRGRPDPLLFAGTARGGWQEFGGITWLDWEYEFVDELPYPQIVGHTRGRTTRQKGRSTCLDAGQSCYGRLHRDGTLEIMGSPLDQNTR